MSQQLLTQSNRKLDTESNNEKDNNNSLLLIDSKDPFEITGQRVNNSTFVRSSQVSSSIRITMANNLDSVIEEENADIKREPMLYRTEDKEANRQLLRAQGNTDSEESDSEINEDENLDKVSEAEDLVLKENAAKQAGRIINDEQNEIIKVEFESYRKYLKFAGGCSVAIIFNFLIMTFIFLQLGANFYTQKWAYATPEDQQDHYEFYALMIFGLNITSALVILVRSNY